MLMKAFVLTLILSEVTGKHQKTVKEVREYVKFLKQFKPGAHRQNRSTVKGAKEWENSGRFQGDMVLRDDKIKDLISAYSGIKTVTAVKNKSRLWPSNTVLYKFSLDDREDTYFTQYRIISAMREIESRSCVVFRKRKKEEAYVKITSKSDGCYADLGFIRNESILNLGPGCLIPSTVIHELFHTLGIDHMHSSYERDEYIRVLYRNVRRGDAHNFIINSSSNTTMLDIPYEYASVMHYGEFAFSRGRRPTMIAKRKGGRFMGQDNFITHWDWMRVRRLYDCPGAWDEPVHDEDANKPAAYP